MKSSLQLSGEIRGACACNQEPTDFSARPSQEPNGALKHLSHHASLLPSSLGSDPWSSGADIQGSVHRAWGHVATEEELGEGPASNLGGKVLFVHSQLDCDGLDLGIWGCCSVHKLDKYWQSNLLQDWGNERQLWGSNGVGNIRLNTAPWVLCLALRTLP